jgi:hypothetical protein
MWRLSHLVKLSVIHVVVEVDQDAGFTLSVTV